MLCGPLQPCRVRHADASASCTTAVVFSVYLMCSALDSRWVLVDSFPAIPNTAESGTWGSRVDISSFNELSWLIPIYISD